MTQSGVVWSLYGNQFSTGLPVHSRLQAIQQIHITEPLMAKSEPPLGDIQILTHVIESVMIRHQ